MQYLIKLVVSLSIILLCTTVGKKFPTLAGLLATVPLTSLLVLIWLYLDNKQDYVILLKYTKGVLWGIIPSVFFFICVSFCLKKQVPFFYVIILSFSVWAIGAFVHQAILR
ncbi:MAG: DUF3147 family protein [Candidatus Omnitrophota bacterium]